MNTTRIFCISVALTMYSISMHAQTNFSIGALGGLGVTPFAVNATITSQKLTQDIKPYVGLEGGVVVQYIIGNLFGVESGLLLNYYSYIPKDKPLLYNHFKNHGTVIEITDLQLPLQLVVNKNRRFKAGKYFKLVVGTSLDWLGTYGFAPTEKIMWMKNIKAGLRIGSENIKHGRIEYGFEYEYALERFDLKVDTNASLRPVINSRLSMLSFNLYYFFIGKTFNNSPDKEGID